MFFIQMLCASLNKSNDKVKNNMIELKRLIKKYLLIVVAINLLRAFMKANVPLLFTKAVAVGEFTGTGPTFFSLYQGEFFNIILGIFISVDLYRIGKNWIIIPILTMFSAEIGIFFFAILILHNLINNHEKI
jgi:hypothetical protein